MVKDLYAGYDTNARVMNSLIPGLGPLYALGNWLGFRWNNRKELREMRSRLQDIAGDALESEGGVRMRESQDFAQAASNGIVERAQKASDDFNERSQKSYDNFNNAAQESYDKFLATCA